MHPCLGPTRLRKQLHAVVLHPALQHLSQKVSADLLQFLVFWPRPNRYESTMNVHIHESHFLKPPRHLGTWPKVHLESGSGELVEVVCPPYGCAVRLHGAVLAFEVPHDICNLDAAAGSERVKGGAKEVRPGRDAPRHGADVDKVEAGSLNEPWLRDIVDLKLDIWRDPGRLDRRFTAIEGEWERFKREARDQV